MRPGVRALATVLHPVAAATHRLRRTPPLSLVGWHRVDDSGDGLSTPVAAFRRHLDELAAWGAVVLPLDDAVDRLRAGRLPERAVALTFDDGYASVVETAWPLLRERGLPATLFAVSDYLPGERRFAWDLGRPEHEGHRRVTAAALVAAAEDGLDVGSHTVSHPWLPRLSPREQRRELVDSKDALEQLLGRRVTSVAYPTGGWDPVVRRAAGEAGYTIGVTVDRGANPPATPLLSLRRSFVPHDPRDLRPMLDGAYTALRPLDSWRRRRPPW
ncbi:polysaccharide deacetylase family protein [Nocardioides sp. cx-169]|uniref:polysaccharide deacetylase family protein n=1 Tax=Nocardioides sp. cx-169 TaxID=2899080 RepID=UPI001E504344|nr:polysaccharide deacetylase family protein [Nocardioides sp. cx-169]MCD4534496.1 polysaccharide deacetylase family protein [Nocardioides sp. cx-169]